jgi:hypothetical protein
MKQSSAVTDGCAVEVLPDLFDYCLIVDSAKVYIPKKRLDAVLLALCSQKERESPGSDWLAELGQSVREAMRAGE